MAVVYDAVRVAFENKNSPELCKLFESRKYVERNFLFLTFKVVDSFSPQTPACLSLFHLN